MPRLPAGKIPWNLISDQLRAAAGPRAADVLLGPAPGEDAALVKIGGEVWAVASDPISFTAADAGRLAVVVNANDVAVTGAEPAFFLAVVLVAPGDATGDAVDRLLAEIRSTCEGLGVALIGGHTEVTPGLPHTLVVGTMLGRVRRRPVTTGGLRAGDRIGMTKWAGLEGTFILLAEHDERLRALDGAGAFRQPGEVYAGDWLLVVPEAAIAARFDAVSALHDVTEGGVGEALYELSRASGQELDVAPGDVPVLPETRRICDDLGLDPLGLIGSGALLVGCAEEAAGELAAAYAERGIPFSWIGHARPATGDRRVPRFPRDEILKASFVNGIRAVVFDMDGTLIDSSYDWRAIRAELGVTQPSLIDELNGLPGPEREAKWRRMREIERQATANAGLMAGARELLALLAERGLRTALVTNNTRENTAHLLDRFALAFDLVLTRDDGFWKPSGAPIAEAVRRLGVPPAECLVVGDSRYDVAAGREAGCGRVFVLHDASGELGAEADMSFRDIDALLRYLRIVL